LERIANAFGSTFAFFQAQSQTKNVKELPSQRTETDNMNEQTTTKKEQRRHNTKMIYI